MFKFFIFNIFFFTILYFLIRIIIKNKESNKANLSLVIISIGLVFYIGEVYLKFFYVKSYGFALLGEAFNRRYYSFDLYGYRNSNLPLSKEKENIIFVGDSFVFGHGIKNPEDRFSDIVRNRCPKYHIVNIGKRDLHTIDEIKEILFLYQQDVKVKSIILSYVQNDIEASIPRDKNKFRHASEINKILFELASISELSLYIIFHFFYPMEKVANQYSVMLQEGFQDESSLNNHVELFIILNDIVEKYFKSRFLILIWPPLNTINEENLDIKKLHVRMDDHHIPNIYLYDEFKKIKDKNLIVNEVDFHPNEIAHRELAEILINKANICD